MKTLFAGVISLAQSQVCGRDWGPCGQEGKGRFGGEWRAQGSSFVELLLSLLGLPSWGSTEQNLQIQLYCLSWVAI